MAPIREVLYVDRRRLRNYVDQFALPLELEKHKELTVALSITGPTAEMKQQLHARERTPWEQFQLLQEHLTKTGQVTTERPRNERAPVDYVHETCHAFRVRVPEQPGMDGGSPVFSFWLSPNSMEAAQPIDLCLMEDLRGDDTGPSSYAGASTYTLLQSLVYFARQVGRSALTLGVPATSHSNPFAQFDPKYPSLREYHNVKDYCFYFVRDPLPLLQAWGCSIAPPRRIEVLYRVREIGSDSTSNWQNVTTFGYPIVILEGSRS